MATTKVKKSQSSLTRPISIFFRRFHLLLFFVLIVGIVAAAVLFINNALTEPSQEEYTSSINAGSIDQATLERIQSLHSSSQPISAPELPEGRINPFAE